MGTIINIHYTYYTHKNIQIHTFISKQQKKLCWTEFLNKSNRIQSYNIIFKREKEEEKTIVRRVFMFTFMFVENSIRVPNQKSFFFREKKEKKKNSNKLQYFCHFDSRCYDILFFSLSFHSIINLFIFRLKKIYIKLNKTVKKTN